MGFCGYGYHAYIGVRVVLCCSTGFSQTHGTTLLWNLTPGASKNMEYSEDICVIAEDEAKLAEPWLYQ